MIIYKKTHHLEQDLEKVFNYFSRKDYFTKYDNKTEGEIITIASEYDNDLMQKSESFKIISEDKETIIELLFRPLEIIPLTLIQTSMTMGNLENKEEDFDENDDKMVQSIMNFIMGKNTELIHFIKFKKKKNGIVRVEEISEVNVPKLRLKMSWKIIGLLGKFKNRKKYLEIKREIEAL